MATKRVFVGIGSNLGDRAKQISQAIRMLGEIPSVTIVKVSSIYETDPVGGPRQGRFLNGVIELDAALAPKKLLEELNGIEQKMGRDRCVRFGPRTIDLDILMYGDMKSDDPSIVLPHPRIKEREFVLKGLCELAPELDVCRDYLIRNTGS